MFGIPVIFQGHRWHQHYYQWRAHVADSFLLWRVPHPECDLRRGPNHCRAPYLELQQVPWGLVQGGEALFLPNYSIINTPFLMFASLDVRQHFSSYKFLNRNLFRVLLSRRKPLDTRGTVRCELWPHLSCKLNTRLWKITGVGIVVVKIETTKTLPLLKLCVTIFSLPKYALCSSLALLFSFLSTMKCFDSSSSRIKAMTHNQHTATTIFCSNFMADHNPL